MFGSNLEYERKGSARQVFNGFWPEEAVDQPPKMRRERASRERERATEDSQPEAGHGQEQGSSSPSSPGQKSSRHSNNSNSVMY